MTAPALVPLEEARKVLGIPRTTAYRIVQTSAAAGNAELAPGLPAFRIGGLWKINRAHLDRFVAGDVR